MLSAVQEECTDLKQQADRASDNHYATITEWAVTGANDETLRQEAVRRASVLRRSLDWLVDCYRRMRQSVRTRRLLDNAVASRQLVENDIETLDRYDPAS